jgi:hypothetical protein
MKKLLIGLLLIFNNASFSQNISQYSISGKVLYDSRKPNCKVDSFDIPIHNAIVELSRGIGSRWKIYKNTDSLGYFIFDSIPKQYERTILLLRLAIIDSSYYFHSSCIQTGAQYCGISTSSFSTNIFVVKHPLKINDVSYLQINISKTGNNKFILENNTSKKYMFSILSIQGYKIQDLEVFENTKIEFEIMSQEPILMIKNNDGSFIKKILNN